MVQLAVWNAFDLFVVFGLSNYSILCRCYSTFNTQHKQNYEHNETTKCQTMEYIVQFFPSHCRRNYDEKSKWSGSTISLSSLLFQWNMLMLLCIKCHYEPFGEFRSAAIHSQCRIPSFSHHRRLWRKVEHYLILLLQIQFVSNHFFLLFF